MSYFGHSFHKYFLGTGVVKTTGHAADLIPGQIGLFNAKTYEAIPLSHAKKDINREVIIGQGSWHSVDSLTPFLGGMQEPVYSRKINGNLITKFYKDSAEEARNQVVTVGFDGVDREKTITAFKDETYKMRIEVKGNAAQRFLFRENYQDYMVKGRCTTDLDNKVPEDAFWIADQFVEQINSNPYQKDFIKAERIFACDTPVADDPNAVEFDVLEVTICDTGDQIALAAVQNLVTTYEVKRVNRKDSLSTYQIIVPTGTTPPTIEFPADYFVPNCPTCPTGFTATAKTYKFVYRLAQAAPATTPTVPSTVPTLDSSVSAATISGYQYLGHANGYSTFYAFLSLPVADVTPAAKASQSLVYTMEEVPTSCISTTQIEAEFALVKTVYKTSRELTVTLPKECGAATSKLTDVQAFYAGNEDVVTGSIAVDQTSDCAEVIRIRQFNNDFLEDGCNTIDVAEYDNLQPFNEYVWVVTEDAPFAAGNDCSVGIKITAAYMDTKFGKCSWDPFDLHDIQPIEIFVSFIMNPPECDEVKWPVTELVAPKQGKGYGETILREYLIFLGYKNEEWSADPRMREVLDFYADMVIDKDKMYDRYVLQHFIPFSGTSRLRMDQEIYTLHFILPAGLPDKSVENLLATYAASNNISLESFS